MATKKKSAKKGNAKAWEIGGAITAATLAAAAGAYMLSDKKTKAKAKKWVGNARKEVVKNAKIAKKLGKKEYEMMLKEATKRYGSIQNMTAAEIIAAGKGLKSDWKKLKATSKKVATKAKTKVKKARG
jgi:hypothetical protein